MLLIIICAVALVLFFIIRKKVKYPKVGAFAMVTGAVKSGKSTFSVGLAIREHKRVLRKVKFVNFFRRLFGKSLEEIPLLYSNIPLAYKYYSPVTTQHLRREARFNYRSICYLCEASLIADSMTFNDKLLNEQINLFCKLFGHATKGGKCIVDTQAICDLHFGFKRNTTTDFFIHHTLNIPLFPWLILKVQEERYSEDGQVLANEDIEDRLSIVFVSKSTWKKFDCYCYSTFTDDKPTINKPHFATYLKVTDLNGSTFRRFYTIRSKKDEN